MNPKIRKYLAEIGRKGGAAGKGDPARITLNRELAARPRRRLCSVCGQMHFKTGKQCDVKPIAFGQPKE